MWPEDVQVKLILIMADSAGSGFPLTQDEDLIELSLNNPNLISSGNKSFCEFIFLYSYQKVL